MKKIICGFLLVAMLFCVTACAPETAEEISTDAQEIIVTQEASSAEEISTEATTVAVTETTTEAETTTKPETTTKAETTIKAETTTKKIEQTTAAPVSTGSFSSSDVACTIKGVTIRPNTKWENYQSAFGQASDVVQAPSCHFDGMDNIYMYNGFSIYTYMNNDVEYVYDIEITSSSYATAKGIRVGSSAQDVLNAYGENYADNSDFMIEYRSGAKSIYFTMNNGVVSMMEFYSD